MRVCLSHLHEADLAPPPFQQDTMMNKVFQFHEVALAPPPFQQDTMKKVFQSPDPLDDDTMNMRRQFTHQSTVCQFRLLLRPRMATRAFGSPRPVHNSGDPPRKAHGRFLHPEDIRRVPPSPPSLPI
jgi:hypothetical protein